MEELFSKLQNFPCERLGVIYILLTAFLSVLSKCVVGQRQLNKLSTYIVSPTLADDLASSVFSHTKTGVDVMNSTLHLKHASRGFVSDQRTESIVSENFKASSSRTSCCVGYLADVAGADSHFLFF